MPLASGAPTAWQAPPSLAVFRFPQARHVASGASRNPTLQNFGPKAGWFLSLEVRVKASEKQAFQSVGLGEHSPGTRFLSNRRCSLRRLRNSSEG